MVSGSYNAFGSSGLLFSCRPLRSARADLQ